MFIEREAIREKLFLQAVTTLAYLVVPSNPVRQVSSTQDWLGFYKIQLSIIFFLQYVENHWDVEKFLTWT